MTIIKKKMWVMLVVTLALTLSSLFPTLQVSAQESEVNIYIFWGEGCPHCEIARPVLQRLAEENQQVSYYEFEVYKHPENIDLFWEFASLHDTEPRGVPTIFIGDRYWVGYSENIKAEIESYINHGLGEGSRDPGEEIPSAELIAAMKNEDMSNSKENEEDIQQSIRLPLIGTLNLSNCSLLRSGLWALGGVIGIAAIILLYRWVLLPNVNGKSGSE